MSFAIFYMHFVFHTVITNMLWRQLELECGSSVRPFCFVLFCFVWLATLGVPVVASGTAAGTVLAQRDDKAEAPCSYIATMTSRDSCPAHILKERPESNLGPHNSPVIDPAESTDEDTDGRASVLVGQKVYQSGLERCSRAFSRSAIFI